MAESPSFSIHEVRIPVGAWADEDTLRTAIFRAAGVEDHPELQLAVLRKSLDARGRELWFQLKVALGPLATQAAAIRFNPDNLPSVAGRPSVLVIGSGPAGLFAAMSLIGLGLRPVVLERGRDVRNRRRDLADLNKADLVNPESNYCFGEGGAGTYSDGKLYTRSSKRGDIRHVLEILVAHGARPDILVEAHPHIGTNKLPPLVASLRETILAHGGEILFDTRVDSFLIRDNRIQGVITATGQKLEAPALILATGHSARDIFEQLYRQSVSIVAKPFALGFRVEHPQELIDQIQYKGRPRGEWLPPASYSLVTQASAGKEKRGVFSFCMCPGGFIVPSMTAPGEIVVNGMSPSRRNSRFANSGMVVAVGEEEFAPFGSGPLAGLRFQASVEQTAASFLPGRLAAPAQRLTDFLEGRISGSFPECSYQPGLTPADLTTLLPPHLAQAMQAGFRDFGRKMKGFLTREAVLLGVESRTSSPVSIPRNRETGEHPQVQGFFPCGEGAGYAGGIMSAALDGIFIARCVARSLGIMPEDDAD